MQQTKIASQIATQLATQSMAHDHHLQMMSLALSLAERGRGLTSPNPMVGCVIVSPTGEILGRGYHQYAGGPHAEVNAIQDAIRRHGEHCTHNAIAYVTLEPCAHVGRTPPCTQALIAARIGKVFVATTDPNPLVSGRGIQALMDANIPVETGLCAIEASTQNEIFFHYITHNTPFIFSKWAMSLDGKTITHENDSRQISGTGASQLTHQLRSQVDAILIGANTARMDDPQLTARCTMTHAQPSNAQQPLRVILSSDGNLPNHLQLFSPRLPGKTIIVTTQRFNKFACNFASLTHVEVLQCAENSNGQVDLIDLLQTLGKRQITSLLVEGGMTVHESLMAENLINKLFVYVSPVLIGKLNKKQTVKVINQKQLMQDTIYEVKYV